MLNGAGYNTNYVHEILQRGQVPDSFGAHLKQRTRWVCLQYVNIINVS